jgi:putative membrane protein
MDMMSGMPAMMLLGAVAWLVSLAVIVFVGWWLARQFRRDSAVDALRERYARGEIDREEFEARRRDLAA